MRKDDGRLGQEADRAATASQPSQQAVSALRVGIPSAGDVREIRNQLSRDLQIAERAVKASDALGWLKQYGGHLASSGSDGASVKVHLNYASSTAYVAEGQAYLDLAAKVMLREIVARAKQLAEEHIAQAIEARRAETQSGSVHESAVPEGNAP